LSPKVKKGLIKVPTAVMLKFKDKIGKSHAGKVQVLSPENPPY